MHENCVVEAFLAVRGIYVSFLLSAERKKESEKDLSKKIKTKPVRRLAEQESRKEERRGEGWLGFTTIIALLVRTRKCVSSHSP